MFKNDLSYKTMATRELSNVKEHSENINTQFSREYIQKWKKYELNDYNLLLNLRERIQNNMKIFSNYIIDLTCLKDIIFTDHSQKLGSSLMSDIVILTSNFYLSFLSLGDLINRVNKILFINCDDENYEFVPFRLVMRQHLKNEQTIRRYENDLQLSFAHISKLHNDVNEIKTQKNYFENKCKEMMENNERINRIIEKKSSSKINYENFDFSSIKEEYEKDFKKVSNEYDNEMKGIKKKLEEFNRTLNTVLSNSQNRFTHGSLSQLRSVQANIGKISSKFFRVQKHLNSMKSKMNSIIMKKIVLCDTKVEGLKERGMINQKISVVRNNINNVSEIIDSLKECSSNLSYDIFSNTNKKKTYDMVEKNVEKLKEFVKYTNKLLEPVGNKISKDEKEGEKEIREIKKTRRNFEMKGSFVSQEEYDKLKLENFRKIQMLENKYQLKVLDLERRLLNSKKKERDHEYNFNKMNEKVAELNREKREYEEKVESERLEREILKKNKTTPRIENEKEKNLKKENVGESISLQQTEKVKSHFDSCLSQITVVNPSSKEMRGNMKSTQKTQKKTKIISDNPHKKRKKQINHNDGKRLFEEEKNKLKKPKSVLPKTKVISIKEKDVLKEELELIRKKKRDLEQEQIMIKRKKEMDRVFRKLEREERERTKKLNRNLEEKNLKDKKHQERIKKSQNELNRLFDEINTVADNKARVDFSKGSELPIEELKNKKKKNKKGKEKNSKRK